MRVSSALPPCTYTMRTPSVTRSASPETATTAPLLLASSLAASAAAATESVDSTPRPPPETPASARISEAFPRITLGPAAASSRARAVRTRSDPIATGSSTQGVEAAPAPVTASRMAAACSVFGVPRLTSRDAATAAKSPASPGTSTMAGDPPAASSTLAVKLVTTVLVRHWTRGEEARSAPRASASSPGVTSLEGAMDSMSNIPPLVRTRSGSTGFISAGRVRADTPCHYA